MNSLEYILISPHSLELVEKNLEWPPVSGNGLLCKTLITGISTGTELAAWGGENPLRPSAGYPRKIGYQNINTSRNAAINDPCRYHGNAHPWKMCYGNPDGPNFRPGFQPKTQGTTGRGRGNGGRFHPGRGNGGGRNDAYITLLMRVSRLP